MDRIDSTALIIGRVPQHFLDNGVIEQVQDLTRTVHAPRKEPGPVLAKDRPWENVPYLTAGNWSTARDPDSGHFQLWYEDWRFDPEADARCERTFQSDIHSRLCYARSDDGLYWEKPELDYLEENGLKTNVVWGNDEQRRSEVSCVFIDPLETDPRRRYKLIYQKESEQAAPTPGGRHRLRIAWSPDGIHWEDSGATPRVGHFGDRTGDGFIVLVDEDARAYLMTCRHAGITRIHHDARRPRTNSLFFDPTYPLDPGRMNKRRIFQAHSSDLVHFSAPQCIVAPDVDVENLDETFYHMPMMRLGAFTLGFLNTLHEVSNTMNVRLAFSRDGWRWHHLNHGQPWLTTTADAWDRTMVNISAAPLAVENEHLVYYGGASNHHDWWINGRRDGLDVPEATDMSLVRYGLGLARLRRDGFVSIDAGRVREGILVTRCLHTEGRGLVLNAACGQEGFIEVEATDPDENVYSGFARGDCDRFAGDDTALAVTWRGQPQIPHGGALRLRFFMRDASLFSFRFD